MLTNKEYEELICNVIKNIKRKKNKVYNGIISDIYELDEASKMCNNKLISFSEIMYQVKYLKSIYSDALHDAMLAYQEIIFPDFSYKNDLNVMINGPYALKIWLVRYLCLEVINYNIDHLKNNEITNLSITRQYQLIDELLFNKTINEKVASN